jgi:hypothetical protein
MHEDPASKPDRRDARAPRDRAEDPRPGWQTAHGGLPMPVMQVLAPHIEAANGVNSSLGSATSSSTRGPRLTAKVTMLDCLSSAIPRERVVLPEEVLELSMASADH